ncbi:DUF6087 family protein [Streptomyces sp. NPDC091212]|uniref:DUF6087 family protein n=1 Tax=Streptomyces sp. NPDC091212 TaxID=3155191 RepID=UPI00343C46B9
MIASNIRRKPRSIGQLRVIQRWNGHEWAPHGFAVNLAEAKQILYPRAGEPPVSEPVSAHKPLGAGTGRHRARAARPAPRAGPPEPVNTGSGGPCPGAAGRQKTKEPREITNQTPPLPVRVTHTGDLALNGWLLASLGRQALPQRNTQT